MTEHSSANLEKENTFWLKKCDQNMFLPDFFSVLSLNVPVVIMHFIRMQADPKVYFNLPSKE